MSQTYKVAADNLVGHEAGEHITADDLPAGTNVDALVGAGVLTPVKKATPKPADKADEQKDTP